ncbi:hypothetical protein LTR70_004094 [Exophiala xenobiotica]|uniref:Phytanoyl-CoA dioxygenase family protein n=1 Tax=Lithohypha guttulata TaxID=1690604 RepID=A0ABR0KG39_9EURO|nr:hypothetical protein LTR24_003626 [Lithohypha guttulata]KAK5321539.1 hypothetical protein LTR70_004094 [Exophiala xenobiotica]
MGSVVGAAYQDQEIHTIKTSDAVRQAARPSLEYIAEAVSFLHKDGIIILENVIDTAHIDHLNSILTPEALEIANNPRHHFNFGKHTWNMDQAPPPTRELMYKDIWANSFAAAVLAAILGPRPVIHYANGNTALQASPDGRQPVHSDCEFDHPVYYNFACVINVNLVDTSPENGATEFWPGTHHVSTPECHETLPGNERILHVKSQYVEQRRKHSPPVQPCTKRGSIIIRDLRLWHAGMPNLTKIPRIMLAFVAQPAWFQGKSKVLLPASVRSLVESWSDELQFAAEWVEGEVDHKKLSSANVDFGSASRALTKHETELSKWPDYVPRWY